MSAIGLFALPALGACGGPSMAPEEELRAWVAAGVDAAESKERQTLVDMMSSAYTDARGNERDDIENLLGRQVYLELFVKVVKDWRNRERDLDEMGIEG